MHRTSTRMTAQHVGVTLLASGLLASSLLLSACTVTFWGPGPGTSTGGNGGPGGTAKLGLAEKSFKTEGISESAAVVDVWAGSYPVAIFMTPASDSARLGAGTLDLKRDGTLITATLSDAGGAEIAKKAFALDGDSKKGWVQVQQYVCQLIVDDYYAPGKRMLMRFENGTIGTDGQVSGEAGLYATDIYAFRNNVEYVGKAVPKAFAHLAGTWKGPQEANTHGKPDVTVTIAADGTVTVSGKGNLDGEDATITAKWDGQDDYIIPKFKSTTGEIEIVIDRQKGGGSQAQGGVKLTVPALSTLEGAPMIKQSHSVLEGMRGSLTVNDPVKQ